MKILLVMSAALVVAKASAVPADSKAVTAYDYHRRFGIPNAENVRKFEEAENPTRISGPTIPSQVPTPYLAGLLISVFHGTSICGASLLSNTRLVTAAHCWNDGHTQASMFTVVLGSALLFSGGTRIQTSKVDMHEDWNHRNIHNDIAIITIDWVSYSNNIQAIALPLRNEVELTIYSHWATVTGFGATDSGVQFIGVLHFVSVQVSTTATCQIPYANLVTDNSICTSGAGGIGLCSGDSGGPLTIYINGRRVLAGIASFGPAECTGFAPFSPSVYTKVGPYTSWILDHL